MPASIRQFFDKSAYGILVGNGELVRVTSHDRTSLFGNYTERALINQSSSTNVFAKLLVGAFPNVIGHVLFAKRLFSVIPQGRHSGDFSASGHKKGGPLPSRLNLAFDFRALA
jgi:hypothetical protein